MGDVAYVTQREPGSRLPETQQRAIVKAYRAGASIRAIAAAERSCYSVIHRVLREHEVVFRPRGSVPGECPADRGRRAVRE